MSCQETVSPSDHYKNQWNKAANPAAQLQIKNTTFSEILILPHNFEYNSSQSEFIQYESNTTKLVIIIIKFLWSRDMLDNTFINEKIGKIFFSFHLRWTPFILIWGIHQTSMGYYGSMDTAQWAACRCRTHTLQGHDCLRVRVVSNQKNELFNSDTAWTRLRHGCNLQHLWPKIEKKRKEIPKASNRFSLSHSVHLSPLHLVFPLSVFVSLFASRQHY